MFFLAAMKNFVRIAWIKIKAIVEIVYCETITSLILGVNFYLHISFQVDELAVVACTSCALSIHITTFKAHMVEGVRCSSGSTSCHHDLVDMKKQISVTTLHYIVVHKDREPVVRK